MLTLDYVKVFLRIDHNDEGGCISLSYYGEFSVIPLEHDNNSEINIFGDIFNNFCRNYLFIIG